MKKRKKIKVNVASLPDEIYQEALLQGLKAIANDQLNQMTAREFISLVEGEAKRLARAMIKDAIKKSGRKLSHYRAKDITKAARKLIQQDMHVYGMAYVNSK